jgi:hypothetical protein
MYLMDPSRGRRRRARLGEAASHAYHRAQDLTGMTARDVQHRVSGLAARTLDRLVEDEMPADHVLVERVRPTRTARLTSRGD